MRVNSKFLRSLEKGVSKSFSPLTEYSRESEELTSKKTLFNSMRAMFFPKQEYFPYPHNNPNVLSILSSVSPLACNHLSGLKIELSSPYTFLLRWIAQSHFPICVPPGTKMPLMVSPSGWTTFDIKPVAGGHIRAPSFMTAWR